jgi:anti-sigma B factor antagonist
MGMEITASGLHLGTEEHGHVTLVTIGGEIDLDTAPGLRALLLDLAGRGRHHLVIDLEDVGFMDSSGLGVLVGGLKRSRTGDGSYQVVCTTERLLAMFRITGLDRAMTICESVEKALANQGQQS